MKHASELILYRNMEHGEFFEAFMRMMETQETSGCYQYLHDFLNMASEYGLEGNLYQTYMTFLLVHHENSYSLACERKGSIEGSINELVEHDFRILRELYHADFGFLQGIIPKSIILLLKDYQRSPRRGRNLGHTVRVAIQKLSAELAATEDPQEFGAYLTNFYNDYGVGDLGLHKAFRVECFDHHVKVCPIHSIGKVELDDLIGYEGQKKKLVENTEAFLKGESANNVLLYGDAGTGKSSSIKAILNQYYAKGLRMIELHKHQYQSLPALISKIKHRNYRFILFLDDLSFEEFETEYKYLKAVIEGGLENKPDNILIYATSNRRHLVREKFSDKAELLDDDLHKNDTVQEKLSLADRFGLSIYFGSPRPKEFEEMVLALADRQGIVLPKEELLNQARLWELRHSGLSGRVAQQFVDSLGGKG